MEGVNQGRKRILGKMVGRAGGDGSFPSSKGGLRWGSLVILRWW
jgi:hypothetical protein